MEKGRSGEAEFGAGGGKAALGGQSEVVHVAPNETETVLRRDVAWASIVQVRLRGGRVVPCRPENTVW